MKRKRGRNKSDLRLRNERFVYDLVYNCNERKGVGWYPNVLTSKKWLRVVYKMTEEGILLDLESGYWAVKGRRP